MLPRTNLTSKIWNQVNNFLLGFNCLQQFFIIIFIFSSILQKLSAVLIWNVWCWQEIFSSSPEHPDKAYGPSGLLFNKYWGSFLEVKWPGYEVNNSSLSSAKVKNKWSYTSAPPIFLHGMDRKNLPFTIMKFHNLKSFTMTDNT